MLFPVTLVWRVQANEVRALNHASRECAFLGSESFALKDLSRGVRFRSSQEVRIVPGKRTIATAQSAAPRGNARSGPRVGESSQTRYAPRMRHEAIKTSSRW